MARRSGRHRAGLGPAVARRLGEAGVQGPVFKNRPASGMAASLPGLLLFSSSRPRLKNCPETSADFACRFRARWRRLRALPAKGARWGELRCAGASRRACSFLQSLEAASENSPSARGWLQEVGAGAFRVLPATPCLPQQRPGFGQIQGQLSTDFSCFDSTLRSIGRCCERFA